MNTVLFDLDGTLLPMDMDGFEKVYFKGLCAHIDDLPPQELIRVIRAGLVAMAQNDGSRTNREAFADCFTAESGVDYYANEDRFLAYYRTDFQKCAAVCGISDLSRRIVDMLKSKGYRIAIATNPIFPQIATWSRLQWLGLSPEEFELVTTFENCCHAKPAPAYYGEVCQTIGADPSDCVMIGNDVEEDGAAASLGMDVILVTDCLLNGKGLPTGAFRLMTLEDILVWAEGLPNVQTK